MNVSAQIPGAPSNIKTTKADRHQSVRCPVIPSFWVISIFIFSSDAFTVRKLEILESCFVRQCHLGFKNQKKFASVTVAMHVCKLHIGSAWNIK